MSPRLHAIIGFQLTAADPQRLVRFYSEALGFEAVGAPAPIPADEMTLYGVPGSGIRIPLCLGHQRLDLETFDLPGWPYPMDASAADLCFQHLAIVTSDIQSAWERAQVCGANPISRVGAVTLPQRSGGVSAVKFRDPEGHPLELIEFPNASSSRWSGKGSPGIDHSAISVADVQVARTFFTEAGLVQAPGRSIGVLRSASSTDSTQSRSTWYRCCLGSIARISSYSATATQGAARCLRSSLTTSPQHELSWESQIDALLHDPMAIFTCSGGDADGQSHRRLRHHRQLRDCRARRAGRVNRLALPAEIR